MLDETTKKKPPAGEFRGLPNAQIGDESGPSRIAHPADKGPFAPLTESELLEAIHPDTVAAEQRGYDAGYRDGFTRGALFAKGECLAEHATVANRIDAAARAFYLMEADDACRKAVGK